MSLLASQPVGILDSGVGGLSVLIEIRKVLPNEDLLYFADSGNCPYGTRPAEQIIALTERVANFLIEKGVKTLVIACNTASTSSVAYLRKKWPELPIIGMVPAVKPAASLTSNGIVGVLATEATGQAPALLDVIDRFAGDKEVIICSPPGLVELVEAGKKDAAETEALLFEYLTPLVNQGADALVLGCTHFPFLKPTIKRLFGDRLTLVDSGKAVARQTRRMLEIAGLLNTQPSPGNLEVFTSGDPDMVAGVIQNLLQRKELPGITVVL